MTLFNMRASGVRTLAVWCLGCGCNYESVLDASAYPDDVPVPSFGPRLRYEVCDHLGADARPNWSERRNMPLGAFAGPTSIGRHHSIRRFDIFLVDPSAPVPPAQHHSPNKSTCN